MVNRNANAQYFDLNRLGDWRNNVSTPKVLLTTKPAGVPVFPDGLQAEVEMGIYYMAPNGVTILGYRK
jgi:hypothetical protein